MLLGFADENLRCQVVARAYSLNCVRILCCVLLLLAQCKLLPKLLHFRIW